MVRRGSRGQAGRAGAGFGARRGLSARRLGVPGWVGIGDVKLAAAITPAFGLHEGPAALVAAVVLGLATASWARLRYGARMVPAGPAIIWGVPLQVGSSEYRLDLLYYHLKLRRFIVMELKTGPRLWRHTRSLGSVPEPTPPGGCRATPFGLRVWPGRRRMVSVSGGGDRSRSPAMVGRWWAGRCGH